jgi:hypothetical protein
MPCQNCIKALEQGAAALYEVSAFHPEYLLPLPEGGFKTVEALAEWIVRGAGNMREPASVALPDDIKT